MNQEITVIVSICKNCNEIKKAIPKQISSPEKIESFEKLAVNDNIREIPLKSLTKFFLRCKCKNHD